MDPYEAPFVSLINADGSWFCPGCHSLNRPGSPHCYSCRAAYPLAVPSAHLGASRKISGGILLISLVLLAGSASVIFGRTNSSGKRAASTPLVIAVEVIETSSPSPDITASISPSAPTTPPTLNAPTAAPTPTPTPEPTAAPTSDRVARPAFPVSVRGAVIAWFSVTGDSPASLIASLQAAGTAACNLDSSWACFSGTYTYTYTPSTDPKSGVCTITSVDLTPTYTIILPRWSAPDRVPAALVDWWKQVLAQLVWHESQHLAIAQSYAPSIKAAIAAGPCTEAGSKAAAKAAMVPLTAAQDDFDAQQGAINWQWPDYSGPWR